jgi:RNA polymerase sigma-70 factor (ECF subfamily)
MNNRYDSRDDSGGLSRNALPFSTQGGDAFVARYREWLLVKARSVCRNPHDAEDLAQETLLRFLQAFGKGEAFPSQKTCETWLTTTLTRLVYDQWRVSRSRAHWAKDPSLNGEVQRTWESSTRPIYDTLTDAQFAQALEALSPKLRTTFELHAAGQKYQEIGRSLGLSLGTVSKRLHDARAKLQKLLLPHTGVGVN